MALPAVPYIYCNVCPEDAETHIYCTGHGFRLPPEIAADRRGFLAANETRDLYLRSRRKNVVPPHLL